MRRSLLVAALGAVLAVAVLQAVTSDGTARVLAAGAAVVATAAAVLLVLRGRR